MIRYETGDLFDHPAEIRVNTVNCVGVMGAGVALAFKKKYPEMFKSYAKACKDKLVKPGKPHVWQDPTFDNPITVVNFPTKDSWRQPSKYEYVEDGLRWLSEYLVKQGKARVTLPALGCGHGGLEWERVRMMIENHLKGLEADILVFPPASSHELQRIYSESAKGGTWGADQPPSKPEYHSIWLDDPYYPDVEEFRQKQLPIYFRGIKETLRYPKVAIMRSAKPEEREVKAIMEIVSALSEYPIGFAVNYGHRGDRPVIREALGHQGKAFVCLVEGIENFKVRKDIQDVWSENRTFVLSGAKPQQKWYPGGVKTANRIKAAIADALLITDPDPQWLAEYLRDGVIRPKTKIFYVDYGRDMTWKPSETDRQDFPVPVGRVKETGLPDVSGLLSAVSIQA